MKINIGPSVEGEDFFGRGVELAWMAEKLDNKKASLLIPGPRRIGKTSLVREFIRRNKNRYKFIYFDLVECSSIVEFCDSLTREIQKTFPGLVKNKGNIGKKIDVLIKMVSEVSVGGVIKLITRERPIITKTVMKQMKELFEELYAHDFILAVDEFSDFLWKLKKNNSDEVELFLGWLRALRQTEKIRMIVTGSINIISTVEELLVPDLINDLIDIEILPLKPGEIKTLFEELLKGKNITFSVEATDFVLSRLKDGVPFFIQLFADSILRYTGGNIKIDSIDEIKKLYDKITGKQHKELVDFYSRLKAYLSETDADAARKILANLAFNPKTFEDICSDVSDLLTDKRKINGLLKRLEDECYLIKEQGYYQFVSPMLADWWKNNYGFEK
jgi:AAA+ ATPase superfamily predicted ATPase